MRIALIAVLGLALAFVAGVRADEKKDEKKAEEVTLKGKITCAKCELKKSKKCAAVIVVKEKDEEVIYYFDAKGHEKYGEDVCGGDSKEGMVTGTVSEKDGKKIITVKNVAFKTKEKEKEKD